MIESKASSRIAGVALNLERAIHMIGVDLQGPLRLATMLVEVAKRSAH
jgi:hypothetical protein